MYVDALEPLDPGSLWSSPGLCIGSLLYIIFTSDLAPVFSFCTVHAKLNADDVQAYQHCLAADAIPVVTVCALSRTSEALAY